MNKSHNKIKVDILQHWVHSFEDDIPGILVFRRSDYSFPRSRRRLSFEFQKNYRFILYGIGSNDLQTKKFGTWSFIAPNRIKIVFEKSNNEKLFDIISCGDDLLKIKDDFFKY